MCQSFVIYLWHSIVYFFGIFKQIRYVVNSWIEYLIKVKAISTQESKESGHYICYKFIDGSLFCFDNAFVNRVDMMEQYKINLIVYRRYDIDPYPWTIDLGFITHVEQLGYSLRHTRSSRGYNVRDMRRPVSNQENTHEQMEVTQEQTVESPQAATTSEEPLDMSIKSTHAPTTSQLPLDMSVSNQVSVTGNDDSCVQGSIVANVNDNVIDSSLQQATSPDVNPKNTDSHESMEVDNLELQQTEIPIAITGDIPSSNLKNIDDAQDGVNMSVDNNNSTVTDVAPCPNEDSLDSKEQGNEGDDKLSVVSDKGTENDGHVQNNELENIEPPNSLEGETPSVSKEHIELSEFEGNCGLWGR